MAILTMLSEIKLGDKKIKVETIVQTLMYYPADKGGSFWIGLTVPRKLRMTALRKELDGYVIRQMFNNPSMKLIIGFGWLFFWIRCGFGLL